MIVGIPALKDNYIWIIEHHADAIVIDPGDAQSVQVYLNQHYLNLRAIILTHHHADHVAGVKDLLAKYSVPVYGSKFSKLKEITHFLKEGEHFQVPDMPLNFEALCVPGHTLDHMAYFLPEQKYFQAALFCGDTLFSAGCGRLFEGTAKQMLHSLDKIAALPGQTLMYCAHEYTLSNLRFAQRCDPNNPILQEWFRAVTALREQGKPTVPTTLALEKQINPFLRVDQAEIKKQVEQNFGQSFQTREAVFEHLRRWKDVF